MYLVGGCAGAYVRGCNELEAGFFNLLRTKVRVYIYVHVARIFSCDHDRQRMCRAECASWRALAKTSFDVNVPLDSNHSWKETYLYSFCELFYTTYFCVLFGWCLSG